MTDLIRDFPRGRRARLGFRADFDGRRAFTLVEVLVALTIIVMAGSALLMATYAAMDSATNSLDQTIAQGIARQFLDEAMGLAYAESGTDPYSPQLGVERGEDVAAGRFVAFDDSDDFAGYEVNSLVDPWGLPLGTGDDQGTLRDPNFQLDPRYFTNWGLKSTVTYVSETDPTQALPAGVTSGMRAIEVSVYKRQEPGTPPSLLVTLRRVYSHVPTPQ